MRYAILADVHGNLPALEAILVALQQRRIDQYICAGDVVGYGPNPVECIGRIERLQPAWVAGNHELMLLGRQSASGGPALVRRTLEWTRSVLPDRALARLAALPLSIQLPGGVVVTHASLVDVERRVRRPSQVIEELDRLQSRFATARVLVLGHTHHVLLANRQSALGWGWLPRTVALPPGPCVLNPGSVGQARGFLGIARAAVLDTRRNQVELLATTYPTTQLEHDLANAGLPRWSYHRSPLRRLAERAERRLRRLARQD
jgi:predicted phosphodiesterase